MSREESTKSDIEWSEAPYIAFSGFAMGTADVVPGVSGGTMALALGIYQQLLGAITSIDAEALGSLLKVRLKALFASVHWRFLATLGFGIVMGMGLMIKVVKLHVLLEEQPKLVYAVFFGLVLASAVILARRIATWDTGKAGSMVLGAVVGLLVVNLVPVSTPDAGWFIFLAGVVAICAMVLPGISGSFILLILGKYAYVLGAVDRLSSGDVSGLSVVVPFALGCLVGITSFSRVVEWALRRWEDTALAGLTGLLIGSLWRIWPYQELTTVVVREKTRVIGATPFVPQSAEATVIGLFVLGIVLVLGIEFVAARRNQSRPG